MHCYIGLNLTNNEDYYLSSWQFAIANIWFDERISYARGNRWCIVVKCRLKEFHLMRRSLIDMPLLSHIISLTIPGVTVAL